MNHVHDSQETTRVEDAWYKLCIVAGKPLSDALGDYFAAVFKQIADQRVEHTTVNLDGKTICTYPVVPEGDVPEWCKQVAKENLSGVGYYDRPDLVSRHSERIQKSFEAELTRRVAEATADKDRRIAELEKNLSYILDKIPGAVRVREGGGPEDLNKSIAVSVIKLIADRDALKQQLAASQAEVERLKADIADLHEPPPSMTTGLPVVEVDICKDLDFFANCAEKHGHHMTAKWHRNAVAEITTLRQQLAVATRPVEDVEELVELTCKESFASFDAVSWLSVKSLMANAAKKAIQRERAARLAAEAERDELREACDRYATEICRSKRGDVESYYIMDGRGAEHQSPSDAVLAAYRAEKGKVQQ